jgi:hypothetical protein
MNAMPKTKINRAAVVAAIHTVCPSCSYPIPPAEILRVSGTEMKGPKCGNVFEAGKATARSP